MVHYWNALLISLLLLSVAWAPVPAPQAQSTIVRALLTSMTPEEKVGQLFIVSFYGTSVNANTDIYRLITQHHVGGVILLAANDNFTDTLNLPMQALTLTNDLQLAAVAGSMRPRDLPEGALPEPQTPPFIPLLIALNHEGNGYPFSELRGGLTELPSEMAIGATWDATQAEAMGRVAGQELAALGVNLLLGPSLDVLENPHEDGNDLGTRVFGGDPFWVGVLGQAYIRGVHLGAANQVAVVAKHFPGHGGSDRRPDEEVPTVRKSLEDLVNFDLVPFFAVTGNAPNAITTADALLTAHIRFQGFQGSIRQNTQPVSFDPQALGQLLELPIITAWRADGGVTISDSLGARAIKRFYDPTETTFNNRRIAREAFNAGNDLLLLSDFGLNPRQDQYDVVVDTLAYFTQLYEADPAFAQRVDAAVTSILTLKLRLYGGTFDPEEVLRAEAGLRVLQQGQATVNNLALAAAVLVSPPAEELLARAPDSPTIEEHIVFFTDVRVGRQCTTCPPFTLLDERELEQAVVDLYGPGGSKQVRTANLQSFSFEELQAYLNPPVGSGVGEGEPPGPQPIEMALQNADWIVFATLSPNANNPAPDVISTFLAQQLSLVRNKKILVFAFDAPYYFLDTTELSKITAFYALFHRTPAAVQVAARLLFRDVTPRGFLPVAVASVGYDPIEVTRPDPRRVIELTSTLSPDPGESTPQPSLKLGDTLTVSTGIIRDHNGLPVPDQTPVRFQVFYKDEGLPQFFDAQTRNGVALFALQLNRPGELEITATSDPAQASETLQINVQQDTVSVTEVIPTALPTDTAVPATDTPPVPVATTASATATPVSPRDLPSGQVDWGIFLGMCGVLLAVGVGGYWVGGRFGVRVALAGVIGTLVGYNIFALGWLGLTELGGVGAFFAALLGGALGLVLGWYWFLRRKQAKA